VNVSLQSNCEILLRWCLKDFAARHEPCPPLSPILTLENCADLGSVPMGWKWACFCMSGMGGGLSGLCMAYVLRLAFLFVLHILPHCFWFAVKDVLTEHSWAHEICTHDNEERAIVVASMNEFAYVIQAWLPLIVWQQIDAPEYRKGYITITFLSAALIATALVTRTLHARELAKGRSDQEASSEGSLAEEEVVAMKGQNDGVVKL
jgi:ACS family pantothenate transporter-like MFS transporter